MKIISIIF